MKLISTKQIKLKNVKFIKDEVEYVVNVINKGLLKGERSFNDVLDKLNCSIDMLEHVAVLYRKKGWNVKVIEDNYQTHSIIFDESEML